MVKNWSLSKSLRSGIIALLCAIVITLFLFYMDEGYYSFSWMNKPGNWIAFAIYTIGFILGQAIANLLILARYKGTHKTLLTCMIGIPLGLVFLFGSFFLITYLNS
jgi:hypothetical protein